jgi:hypothetical protein
MPELVLHNGRPADIEVKVNYAPDTFLESHPAWQHCLEKGVHDINIGVDHETPEASRVIADGLGGRSAVERRNSMQVILATNGCESSGSRPFSSTGKANISIHWDLRTVPSALLPHRPLKEG